MVSLALGAPSDARAAGWLDAVKDPDDGQLDLSDWLLDQKGFLPVPIIITEPAVGFGAGVVAAFFRESIREAASHKSEDGRLTPPDIYAIGGAATENGTWMGLGGGKVSFEEGRYRWRGGISRMSVNLDFFGIGGQGRPLSYNLDGWVSMQEGMLRLGQSDVWLVGRWNYLDLKNRFGVEGVPALSNLERATRESGLGLLVEVDTRDNIFTPSRGWTGSLDATFYDPDWGGDTRFQSYRGHAFMYFPVGREFVVAGRVDGRAAEGRVPFYMLPFVDLRGVPVGGCRTAGPACSRPKCAGTSPRAGRRSASSVPARRGARPPASPMAPTPRPMASASAT